MLPESKKQLRSSMIRALLESWIETMEGRKHLHQHTALVEFWAKDMPEEMEVLRSCMRTLAKDINEFCDSLEGSKE